MESQSRTTFRLGVNVTVKIKCAYLRGRYIEDSTVKKKDEGLSSLSIRQRKRIHKNEVSWQTRGAEIYQRASAEPAG